ncbi:hypothetical protein F5Y17DRAFT_427276 [Xylariaceae sp. FL0594]|nr:hypothetical protein F5Y17DRAFT_427276 [Xylariaceae sp. FL0594]
MARPPSGSPWGHQRSGKRAKASIGAMPVEILLEIMECMGAGDLLHFGLTNKFFYSIFAERRTQLLLNVVRNCPELEILLRIYMVNEKDFLPDRMLRPITVTFAPDDCSRNDNHNPKICYLLRSSVHWRYGRIVCPEKIRLGVSDLVELVRLTRVVDWWVDMYPQLRWRDDNAEDRRRLRPGEQARLRRALARWWLYGEYFHGVFWRNTRAPKRFDGVDARLHHVRVLSTQEILELDDLMSTMYETVSKDLCSSPGKVYRGSRAVVELIPWGRNGDRHPAIVNTYLKLGPRLLKHFLLLSSSSRRKEYLIAAMSGSARDLLFDQETLSMAIATVLEERAVLANSDYSEEEERERPKHPPRRTGIIDEDRVVMDERWTGDAWTTGYPPITPEQLAALPLELTRRVPRGDDGADRGSCQY